MASKAISGQGTIFRRWNGAAWQQISEITGLSGPGKSRETIDVTSLNSLGGYKEFIASFKDSGQVTLKMNFTRATYELMNDDFEDDDLQNYEIVLPDIEHTSIEFEGLVTDVGLDVPLGDKISSDCTIKISGPTTTNSGASTGL